MPEAPSDDPAETGTLPANLSVFFPVAIGGGLEPYDPRVLITEVSGAGAGRTWRPPVMARVAVAVCLGALTALPGLWLALILVTNQVPDGGWIALGLAVAAWGPLAWRALGQSVTLTSDALVIRNILATAQVPLASVTSVGFRRGRLTVTSAHGPAAGQWLTVSAVELGSSRWSGRSGDADAVAAAIASAAGLPPLPPRTEIVSYNWAWALLLAGASCLGLGAYCGPLGTQEGWNTSVPFALQEAGPCCSPSGRSCSALHSEPLAAAGADASGRVPLTGKTGCSQTGCTRVLGDQPATGIRAMRSLRPSASSRSAGRTVRSWRT